MIYTLKYKKKKNIIYRNNEEYMYDKIDIKFFKSMNHIYKNNELILEYKYFDFLCIKNITITNSLLPFQITIIKKLCNFYVIFDKNKYLIKYIPLAFKYKILLNNKIIGTIEIDNLLKMNYIIKYNTENKKIHLQSLMVILMYFTNNAYVNV